MLRTILLLIFLMPWLNDASSQSGEKSDIKGVRPGMPLDEVVRYVSTNDWPCVRSGPNSIMCRLADGELIVHGTRTLRQVYRVEFAFTGGGVVSQIAEDIERQYSIRLRSDQHVRRYETSLKNGMEVVFTNESGRNTLSIQSEAIQREDERAFQKERPVVPRF